MYAFRHGYMMRGKAKRSPIHLFYIFFLAGIVIRTRGFFLLCFNFNSEIRCKEMSEIDTFMSIYTRFLPERWMNNVEQDVAILELIVERMKLRQIFAFDTNAHYTIPEVNRFAHVYTCINRIILVQKIMRKIKDDSCTSSLFSSFASNYIEYLIERKVDRLNNWRKKKLKTVKEKTKASKIFTDAVHYRIQAGEVVAITHLTIRPSISSWFFFSCASCNSFVMSLNPIHSFKRYLYFVK